jgi:uncharacterized protein
MNQFLLGMSGIKTPIIAHPSMLNRHGLITGATGTGKTVSLQVIAEQFSRIGTSVLITDIKGDVSGIAKPIIPGDKLQVRLSQFEGFPFVPQACPVNFIDLFGEKGHPLRVTPLTLGPVILSRLLDLNETQEGVLHIAFRFADEQGLLLLDLKDLQSLLREMGTSIADIKIHYGNISPASIGAIQRRLLVLEDQGAGRFFGEPEFQVKDLLLTDYGGKGLIHLLDSTKLFNSPRLYGAVLLWLLSELFEQLDEVGDTKSPRLALFFDEAHLLFRDLPKTLEEKIETVVRLIRSKGVSVFFVTQSSADIPQRILGQLGTKVQHALRAYTPQDQQMIRQVSKTFRQNENINIEEVLTTLSVGEALVSVLSPNGEPLPVERTLMKPPESQIGPISDEERSTLLERSFLSAKYAQSVDRESAYELLKKRAEEALSQEEKKKTKELPKSKKAGPLSAFFTSFMRSMGSQVGRQIMRGILGTLSKK